MNDDQNADFTELRRLLVLKRYETPPPAFYEDFLSEFHRRQRAELLRRPLWRIALDRLESLFPTPVVQVPNLAYAGGLAVILLAAGAFSKGVIAPAASPVAMNQAVIHRESAPISPVRLFDPNSGGLRLTSALADTESQARVATARRPRYVLDAQPVSYEPRSTTF